MSSYDVTILTSGHDVADARLHREAAALVAAGMSVEVLGLGRVEDSPPGTAVRTWPRGGGLRRAGLATRMAAQAGGRVLMSLDPDSALAAHTAVLASGRELVVDVHEDYSALLADRAWASSYGGLAGRAGRQVVRGFHRIAGRAALTVVADEHVPPLRARRRFVLPNEPDLTMLPEPSDPDPEPRMLYVGDVRTSRGLFAMLTALQQAPSWSLDIVGPVAPADQAELDALLGAHPDLAARVRFHGRKPPREAWKLARGAWVGLILLHDTPAFRDALPSKVGEYLACGLPVLTTDLPRQAAVVRRAPGRGPVGDVVEVGDDELVGAAVAARLEDWAEVPRFLHGMREDALAASVRGREADDPYARFAQAVADLLTGPSEDETPESGVPGARVGAGAETLPDGATTSSPPGTTGADDDRARRGHLPDVRGSGASRVLRGRLAGFRQRLLRRPQGS